MPCEVNILSAEVTVKVVHIYYGIAHGAGTPKFRQTCIADLFIKAEISLLICPFKKAPTLIRVPAWETDFVTPKITTLTT